MLTPHRGRSPGAHPGPFTGATGALPRQAADLWAERTQSLAQVYRNPVLVVREAIFWNNQQLEAIRAVTFSLAGLLSRAARLGEVPVRRSHRGRAREHNSSIITALRGT